MKVILWLLNIVFIGVLLISYGSVDTADFMYLAVLNFSVYQLLRLKAMKKKEDELMIINPRRWK